MSATSTAAVASPASFGAKMLEMRDNEETMNVGKKWTVEEDIKLAQEIAENKTYEEIAKEHKRTANSIKLRVISHIIYPKIKDNLDVNMEEVALEYNVDTSQLIRQINKIIIKGEPKPTQKEYLPTNKDILDYLRKLDSKLDEINSKLDNLEYLR
uniref:Uncharacterized protein n=1 Tax=viral metagenome TaxID=1070528 RepID=A0A6C0K7U7_9ZZZZ